MFANKKLHPNGCGIHCGSFGNIGLKFKLLAQLYKNKKGDYSALVYMIIIVMMLILLAAVYPKIKGVLS